MISKISFRGIITISMFLIYLTFTITVFYIFNNSYKENSLQKYIEQNNYSAKVASDLLEQEKANLLSGARIIASDDTVYHAFQNNIYISSDWINKGEKVEAAASLINKIRYIQLANMQKDRIYGKGRGSEEKFVSFYDANFFQSGFSADYPKEFLDTGKEMYIISSKGVVDVGGVEISLIQKNEKKFFIKGVAPIGKNRRSLDERYNHPGVLTLGENLNGQLLDKFKGVLNRDLFLIAGDEIITSTVFKDSVRIENMPKNIKSDKDDNKPFFKVLDITGKKMGITFFPILDYEKTTIAYLGVGFYFSEIEELYKKNAEKFIKYEIIFSIVIFIVLYSLLKILFRPFNEILEVLKKIDNGSYNERLSTKKWKELKRFAETINSLSESVEKREGALKELNQTLEEKVEQRTHELQENINRLKLTQDQLIVTEKVASIGKLAGGIAHEINSPLGAILTSAQYMKISVQDVEIDEVRDELNESISTIEAAAKKSKNIIGKLLSYTDGGSRTSEVFDLTDLIENAMLVYNNEFEKLNIKLNIIGEKGILVKGNFSEMVNVLSNIISNSRDAIEKKNISNKELEIKIYEEDEKAFIEIFDNGIGIKESDKVRIFDPFYTTKDVGKGMGLGLSISYDIVKKHNAKIKVESDFGVGTRVIIELVRFK